MFADITLEAAIKKLEVIRDGIEPVVVRGDEDSIDLTPEQRGYIAGLNRAISVLQYMS
jgi:hypothetical protein